MENIQNLLSEITNLTRKIETEYPELYRNLDEIPETIPSESNPTIDENILKNYLESLNQLLRHHIETHRNIEKKA